MTEIKKKDQIRNIGYQRLAQVVQEHINWVAAVSQAWGQIGWTFWRESKAKREDPGKRTVEGFNRTSAKMRKEKVECQKSNDSDRLEIREANNTTITV